MILETDLTIQTYVEDTDFFGVVHHSVYVNFYERGRTEWLRENNWSLSALKAQGYALVVSKLALNFLKPLHMDSTLIVKSKLKNMKLAVAVFEQEILNKNGELCSNAKVNIVSLDSTNTLCNFSQILTSSQSNVNL